MSNNDILAALSMDLKRAALGYHRNSLYMAVRFIDEAKKRHEEVDSTSMPDYMQKILAKLQPLFSDDDIAKKADNLLMYSQLIQNYVVKKQLSS